MATTKQKKVLKKLLENTGKSVSKAMRESGYAKGTAKNPQQLTRSKGWNELMEDFIPDKKLMESHKKLLDKKEFIAIGKKGEREVLMTGEIDPDAVARGLDMAYKLKQKYKPTQIEFRSFAGWTNKELESYAKTGIPPARFAGGDGSSER